MSTSLQELYDTYTSLHATRGTMTPDDFDTAARRLRKKIRDAGGSVTTLNLSSTPVPRDPNAPVDEKAPRAPREPKASREKKNSPLHQTTSKGSSAPTYKAITAGESPTTEHVDKIVGDMPLRNVNYHDLARMRGPEALGLGFVVYHNVTAKMILDKFAARYPTITPEWFSVSRPAQPQGVTLIVVGPVNYDPSSVTEVPADNAVDDAPRIISLDDALEDGEPLFDEDDDGNDGEPQSTDDDDLL